MFVSDDWRIEQQLICVQLLAKSLCGEEIARELISVLQVTALIGAMHDRASINSVVMRTLRLCIP